MFCKSSILVSLCKKKEGYKYPFFNQLNFSKMKKILTILSFFVLMLFTFINFQSSSNYENSSPSINLGFMTAQAQDLGEIDYPGEGHLICRCHDDGNCYGGNWLSFRAKCAEFNSGTGDCSAHSNNCPK